LIESWWPLIQNQINSFIINEDLSDCRNSYGCPLKNNGCRKQDFGCPFFNVENKKNSDDCKNSSGCPFSGFGRFSSDCPMFKSNSYFYLHQKALEYLTSSDKTIIQKGKECILEILKTYPNDITALYNLACADSLLGNIEISLNNLERSIELGFQDLTHILNDQDLNNIKFTERFSDIIRSLEQKLNQSNKGPQNDTKETSQQKTKESPLNQPSSNEESSLKIQSILSTLGIDLPTTVIKDLLDQYHGNTETILSLILN